MCEFSGKLIAWLDRELPADEAAAVEQHLKACRGCRDELSAYKRVSGEIDAYCIDAIASTTNHQTPSWMPGVAAAGAVAALLAVFLVWPRVRTQPAASHAAQVAEAVSFSPIAKPLLAPATPVKAIHRRPLAALAHTPSPTAASGHKEVAYALPDERVIQIAIPADDMFPPGAVPQGMQFVADMTIAADGSAELLQLRPRLEGFPRRDTQP